MTYRVDDLKKWNKGWSKFDAFSVSVIVLGLGLTPYVSFNMACLVLIAYLLLCVLVFVRTSAIGEFKISYGRLGPTEIRVFAILLNTCMYFGGEQTFLWRISSLSEISFSLYDLFLAALALLLLCFFLVTAVRETVRLAKENK